jgi:hypothetical protein
MGISIGLLNSDIKSFLNYIYSDFRSAGLLLVGVPADFQLIYILGIFASIISIE